mmetsp:Transcript_9203/g.26953  ORF Transcript_9203/g.26953 Transcript_9203/m.26953 type:complete len:101 (-) Transcript_9203:594-896(-)
MTCDGVTSPVRRVDNKSHGDDRSASVAPKPPQQVWQPSFTLLKNSLDVRIALGSLGYIDAVLKLRKRYRLYPSWLVAGRFSMHACLVAVCGLKLVLLRPL